MLPAKEMTFSICASSSAAVSSRPLLSASGTLKNLFFRTKTRGGVFEFAEKLDRLFPHLVNVRSLAEPTESRVARMSDCMWSSWDVTKACVGYLQNARCNNNLRQGSSLITASKPHVVV